MPGEARASVFAGSMVEGAGASAPLPAFGGIPPAMRGESHGRK
jgi:hypothetical protein